MPIKKVKSQKQEVKSSSKKITLFVLSFCLLVFNFYMCDAGEPPKYEIDARIDTKNHSISAAQNVTFTNNADKPVNELYFHIYPHRKYTPKEIRFMYRYAGYFKINPFPEGFQSGDLKVTRVASLGKELTFIVEGKDQTLLKVNLHEPLEPQASVTVNMDFSVAIPHSYGRFGWHKEIISLVRWYPILSVLDKDGWHTYPFYIYHQPHFSEAALYRVSLRLPKTYSVAASGAATEEKLHEDGTKSVLLETELPVRDFGVSVHRGLSVYALKEGSITVRSYYLQGDEARGQSAAAYAVRLMRFYTKRFGEYPYKEFNIVPSYLGYGGVQSSCMVFIDTRAYRLPGFLERYFDFLISHETGHQWFFNLIGSDEYKEMFLDEGMNSYWILEYLEDTYGRPAFVMSLAPYLKWLVPNFSFRESTIARYLYLAKHGLNGPVIGPLSSFQEPSSIFALTYGKGACVLDMLAKQVGEEVFARIMKRYTHEFRFKNMSLEAFMRICNEESGGDLAQFFHGWLKTKMACDYAIKSVTHGKIILENRGTLHMPVDVVITYPDGSQETHHWDDSSTVKELAVAKRVSKVEIDPEQKIILDVDRTNNNWPKRLFTRPVPLYYFIYEVPLFLPRDTHNAVYGPSVRNGAVGLASSLQKPYDGLFRISSHYDMNDKEVEYRLGYEFSHLGNTQTAVGFELFDVESRRKNDRAGGKLYLRKELWPASYGLFDVNDHLTLYLLRDQKLQATTALAGAENSGSLTYNKKDEAIVGLSASLGRYGPYADPCYGWKIAPAQEFAGHFLGGKEAFWRSSLEFNKYQLLVPQWQHTLAVRTKCGWGEPSERNLFDLGGVEGLRGYGTNTLEGAHMLLGSAEYRLPLLSGMRWYFLDNFFCLNKIQLVGFFDGGKVWGSAFARSKFKKDAGFGLRLHFDILGFLEKAVLRFDVAEAIDDSKEDIHFWFGLSHSF